MPGNNVSLHYSHFRLCLPDIIMKYQTLIRPHVDQYHIFRGRIRKVGLNQRVIMAVRNRGKSPGTQVQHTLAIGTKGTGFRHFLTPNCGTI